MATDAEKEQLIETLRFTPRTYSVELTGYGGEVYWGTVERKIYDFFKAKEINIEQFANSWDDEMWADIPEDMRPFSPGSPYDIGGVHESGCTFDASSRITVYDENGEEVWSSALGIDSLEASKVAVNSAGEDYIDDHPEGTVIFYGAQGEKGLFFQGDIELTTPFDPSKLTVSFQDLDGWELVYGVSYDGEDLDSNDYSTDGKWAENKWIIVGDTEEVYDGVERGEEEEADDDE